MKLTNLNRARETFQIFSNEKRVKKAHEGKSRVSVG